MRSNGFCPTCGVEVRFAINRDDAPIILDPKPSTYGTAWPSNEPSRNGQIVMNVVGCWQDVPRSEPLAYNIHRCR